MDRKKKKNYNGLYVGICCFMVVAGIIGFAGSRNKKEQEHENIENQLQISNDNVAEKQEEPPVTEKEQPKAEKTVHTNSNTAVSEPFKLSRPVKGKVITEYSADELIYNEALKDWRTHDGIDLEAKLGDQVFAASNGIVGRVYDSNMGRSVVIDHQNGYETIYSNLSEDTTLKKDDEIAEGDVIGTVGNTALGDATDAPHLHFEVLHNGKLVNPTDLLE